MSVTESRWSTASTHRFCIRCPKTAWCCVRLSTARSRNCNNRALRLSPTLRLSSPWATENFSRSTSASSKRTRAITSSTAIGYGAELAFSDRELGELRALVGDMSRTADSEIAYGRTPSFNYRLRLLSICYGLTPQQAAHMAGTDAQTVRRWRTNPHSHRFIEMREEEFTRFEHALFGWASAQSQKAARVETGRT